MWVCKKCNEENMDLYAECQKCGNAREETGMDTSDQPEEISEKAEVEMVEEEIPPYRRKPKTASIFDGLAIALLCCGGLGAIICFAQAADLREAAEKLGFVAMGFGMLLGSGISGLFLHAFAELIWNTAVTKNCMVRLVEKYAKDEAAETQD